MASPNLKFEIHRRSTPWIFIFGFVSISVACWLSFLSEVMPAWFAVGFPLTLLIGTILVQLWPRPKVVFDMLNGKMHFKGPNVLPEETAFIDIDRIEIQTMSNEEGKLTVFTLQAIRKGRTSLHIFTSDVYDDVLARAEIIHEATKIEFRGADAARAEAPKRAWERRFLFLAMILMAVLTTLAERCSR